MDPKIPGIIAEALDSEIIPGTLGLRTGVISELAKPDDQIHPNEIFSNIRALSPVMQKCANEFARLVDLANGGGSKQYVNDARLKAYEVGQISNQLAELLEQLGDAIGLHKLKIK